MNEKGFTPKKGKWERLPIDSGVKQEKIRFAERRTSERAAQLLVMGVYAEAFEFFLGSEVASHALLWEEAQEERRMEPPESLGHAAWTILTATCMTSLDHVLAIASIGHGRPALIVVGLGVSAVLTLTGSVLIAELMNRYPFLVTLGAGLLAWTDGRMIATDTVVSQAVAFEFGVNLKDGPLGLVVSFMMTAVVLVVSRQRNA